MVNLYVNPRTPQATILAQCRDIYTRNPRFLAWPSTNITRWAIVLLKLMFSTIVDNSQGAQGHCDESLKAWVIRV